jgi:hypothetical protein
MKRVFEFKLNPDSAAKVDAVGACASPQDAAKQAAASDAIAAQVPAVKTPCSSKSS